MASVEGMLMDMRALGVKAAEGTALRADFGATFGNKADNDTALRSYWSNRTAWSPR